MGCLKLEYYQNTCVELSRNTDWRINYAGKELTSKSSSETLRSDLPFGELFVEQRSTANYYTPYKFSGKEKDEETSYSYFGARYYMSDVSVWLSVDPMAEEREWLSPYNYCQLNPIVMSDPDGALDSPIFDKKGVFLGTDKEGYSGEIYVFNDPSKFKQGMNHTEARNEAKKNGEILNSNSKLPDAVFNKILNHVVNNTQFPNGTILKNGKFNVYKADHGEANAYYLGLNKGKYTCSLDLGDYEWTVENIKGLITHEIFGHGVKKWNSTNKTHHKCYYSQIDSKYWQKSTSRYKSHVVTTMYEYYYQETGSSALPLKYYNAYIKHSGKAKK